MKYFKVVHHIQVYVRQKFKKPGDHYMVAKLDEKDASLMEAGLVEEVTESDYHAWLKNRNSKAIKIKETNTVTGPISVGNETPKVEPKPVAAPPKEPEKVEPPKEPKKVEPPKEPEKVEPPKESSTVKPGYDEHGPIKGTADYKALSRSEKMRLGTLRKKASND